MGAADRADSIVENLRDSMVTERKLLDYFPTLLKSVIADGLWRERVVARTGEVARFARFEEFVVAAPYAGLGITMEMLKNLCRGDMELLATVDAATQRRRGERVGLSSNLDNIQISNPNGTSSQRAMRQLRQRADAGDEQIAALYAAVLAGEMSPHAAVVEAGLRTRTATVPVDPVGVARWAKRTFTAEQIAELLEALR
jgi:hypothetical protein